MHILFIDESGTPPSPQKLRHKYFVIGGIIIPEEKWHKMRDGILGLKLRRKILGEIKWRYFAPGNNEASNPMKDMSKDVRDAIRLEIYGKIICSERSIKTMGCVTCIEAAYDRPTINTRDDLYENTYKPVSERFQYHLQDLTRQVGRSELGIVVSDDTRMTSVSVLTMRHYFAVRETSSRNIKTLWRAFSLFPLI